MKNVEQQLHDYFQSLPEAKRAPAPTTAEFLDSTPTEPDMNNTPRTLAVAAVALIAFGIGLFAFLGVGNDDEVDVTDSVSTETTTTTEAELTTSSLASEPDESVDERAATLATAERFADAFVAFDPLAVEAVASEEMITGPTLTWMTFNEALNMEFLERNCQVNGQTTAVCTFEHRDDLALVLNGPEGTTKTELTLFVSDGQVVSASYFFDNPPNFMPALTWAGQQNEDPSVGPCAQFGDSMPTPAECAEALVAVLQDWPDRYDAETGG